jgi:hypothetical protein
VEEPVFARSFGLRGGGLGRRWKRESNDLTAGRAEGEMRESLLLLMRGQRVLDKSVELVRIWMMPGLEEIAHR